ncbi:hypothetical protein B0H11DRAFT_1929493 [Mycena galericulata]|nr:hypothetical protein B0H11DRAFT_1929493 [Mycena galericulata]
MSHLVEMNEARPAEDGKSWGGHGQGILPRIADAMHRRGNEDTELRESQTTQTTSHARVKRGNLGSAQPQRLVFTFITKFPAKRQGMSGDFEDGTFEFVGKHSMVREYRREEWEWDSSTPTISDLDSGTHRR